MKKSFLFILLTTLYSLLLTGQTPCPNLVTNSDFETGNIAFTSALTSNSSCVLNTYVVSTNFNLKCQNFPSSGDHTTGTGKFLIVQGGTAVNVWATTVTVVPNTPYTFSFWLANAVTNTMTYAMIVNGVNVNQFTATQATPTWTKYTFTGVCPAGVTSLPIAIKQITSGEAFTFGIDDISFTACSNPTDFPGFKCGQAVVSCFSGLYPDKTVDPNGPVLALVDVRQHATAPLGVNWSNTSSGIYHRSDWKAANMGQIFGVTIDAQNNVYAASTTMYGYFSPLTNAAYGNVYKIDALTGNWTVFATLPQGTTPAGLGDVWYDALTNRLLVSNFYDGIIYQSAPLTGSPTGTFTPLYNFKLDASATPIAINTLSPGFIPLGQRVWAIATTGTKMYFSVWSEDRIRTNPTGKNQIWSVVVAGGVVTPGSLTLEHNMSDLNLAGTNQTYSSPVSDIQFSQSGKMLVAERSMNNDFGDASSLTPQYQAHEARVIEITPPFNSPLNEKIFYVGNPYDNSGSLITHHANSSGGISYGYESFNPKITPVPVQCDSMVWSTGDALRYPGFNIKKDPSTVPCGSGFGDFVYGLAGMRSSGNSNIPSASNYVNKSSIYIDVDDNICDYKKSQIGDVDIFKCGCTTHASLCDSIKVTSAPFNGQQDTCCFKLTVHNQKPNYFTAIQLCAPTGVSISAPSSLNGWSLCGFSSQMVTVCPPPQQGSPVPVGNIDFIKFCLSNYQSVPSQQVIVKYLGPNSEEVCRDTLIFRCTQKPKCLKATTVAECAEKGTYKITFCIMSNLNIGFNVASFVLNPQPGVTFTPSVFTGLNIPPGQTQCNFVTTVSGPGATDGKTICFSITGHAQNALPTDCCTDTVMQACVTLPICVCNKVSASVMPVNVPGDSCCWKINLTNNYSNTYFTGIQLDILTPGVVFGAVNFNAGWGQYYSTPTHIVFKKFPIVSYLGVSSTLPTFCLSGIDSLAQVPQIIVLKWLGPNGEVVCDTTLKFNCPPPIKSDCAVLINPKIDCDPNSPGGYTFSFQVFNNSNAGFSVNKVTLSGITGGTISPSQFSIPSLAYGGTSGVLTTNIFGALPGSQVCFYLTVHDTALNGNELNCCTHSEKYCFTMPTCPDSCNCGPFNILYSVGHGPLLKKNCGDTLTVPASPNLPILFLTSFQCVGTTCRTTTVDWVLTGPQGFVTQSMTGVAATPGFSISITNATFSISGTYTLTMTGHCGTHLCVCVIKFVTESKNCCQDINVFNQNIANFISVTVDNANCKAKLNIGNLPMCDMIQWVNWGQGPQQNGPFAAGAMPMYTYTGSGTYIISFLVVEKNPATGAICFEKIVRDTIKLVCDTCQCGTFSEMFVRPTIGGQSLQVTCGQTLAISCPKPGFSISFTGKFECQGTNCPAPTQINWTLTGPSGTNSGTIGANPYFSLPILPTYFGLPGLYTLTLQGSCGGKLCPPCIIKFTVECPNSCPCDPIAFQKDISKGFANILWNNSCKACFSPIALTDCDMVEWFVNGISIGKTGGTQSFCYTFPSSGTYTVMMIVIRKNSNGTICAQGSFSKKVTVTCTIWADCSNSIFANPKFSQGAVAGILGAGGTSTGWKALSGKPYVLEGKPAGTLDGWAMAIAGNLDSSDVLSSVEPICLKKDSGMITLRMASDPVPGADIKLGRHPPRGNISIQLYQGNTFNINNCGNCYKLASIIDILPLDSSDWVQIQIPYNLSDWVGLDSCGTGKGGILARLAVFVNSPLGSNQGGVSNGYRAELDNLCATGQLISVKNPDQQLALRIFPNPNLGTFTVELPAPAPTNMIFRVTDLTGKLLQEKQTKIGTQIQTVEAGNLPDGFYFLQVVSEGKIIAVEKFVKQ